MKPLLHILNFLPLGVWLGFRLIEIESQPLFSLPADPGWEALALGVALALVMLVNARTGSTFQLVERVFIFLSSAFILIWLMVSILALFSAGKLFIFLLLIPSGVALFHLLTRKIIPRGKIWWSSRSENFVEVVALGIAATLFFFTVMAYAISGFSEQAALKTLFLPLYALILSLNLAFLVSMLWKDSLGKFFGKYRMERISKLKKGTPGVSLFAVDLINEFIRFGESEKPEHLIDFSLWEQLLPKAMWYLSSEEVEIAHSIRGKLKANRQKLLESITGADRWDDEIACENCFTRAKILDVSGYEIPVCRKCGRNRTLVAKVGQITALIGEDKDTGPYGTNWRIPVWNDEKKSLQEIDFNAVELLDQPGIHYDWAIAALLQQWENRAPEKRDKVRLVLRNRFLDLSENARRQLATMVKNPLFIPPK